MNLGTAARVSLALVGAALVTLLSTLAAGAVYFGLFPAKASNNGFWDVLAPMSVTALLVAPSALVVLVRRALKRPEGP